MFPTELPARTLSVPGTAEEKQLQGVVYFSGSSLRHQRLGYLLQREFPGIVKGWFVIQSKPSSKADLIRRARERVVGNAGLGDLVKLFNSRHRQSILRKAYNVLGTQIYQFDYRTTEKLMFASEVERLQTEAKIHPEPISGSSDPKLTAFFAGCQPYFLVTFGGPLLGRSLLESVRGVAINQHAGTSPEMKGSHTTEMALYHRRLDWVGTTVHLMDSFADSGDILRRSLCTLHQGDSVAQSFLSVTALGNQLVIESVRHILANETVTIFSQPKGGGRTILNSNLSAHRRRDVLKHGRSVIREELAELREF